MAKKASSAAPGRNPSSNLCACRAREDTRSPSSIQYCAHELAQVATQNRHRANVRAHRRATSTTTGVPAPRRDTRPADNWRCRTSAAVSELSSRTSRSSRDVGSKNLAHGPDTHSPRHQRRGKTWLLAACAHAVDAERIAHDVVTCRVRWPGNADSPDIAASAPRQRHKRDCSNGSADGAADKLGYTLSEDKSGHQDAQRLDHIQLPDHVE